MANTLNLKIENMSCGACVRRVAQTLNQVPGTRAEEVQLGSARVASDSSPEAIISALGAAGFPAQVHNA